MKRSLIISILTLAGMMAAGRLARGQETNSDSGLDYKSFQVISRHNIFDPARRGDRPSRPYVAPTPRARVESFTLVGTMSYEQGQYAFFDSSSSQYRKTLKPSDTIAGYKILQITTDYIQLAASSNQTINLPVGTRMRRQEGGPWMVSGSTEGYADSPAARISLPVLTSNSSDTPEAPPSASEADALKRLMLKRLQEK